MATLCDPASTTIILRGSARNRCDRRGGANLSEVRALGLSNQRLVGTACSGPATDPTQRLHRWKTRQRLLSDLPRRSRNSRAMIFGFDLSTCWG